MLLTKITLNDFGVYRGRNEFDLKTTPEKPIVLCGGTNGAGKTTLFESIMLCLYGIESFDKKMTQKDYHQVVQRSIHRFLGTKKSADEASIIVQFQYAHEGKISEYQVMRMWQNNDGRIDEKFSIKEKISEDKFTQLGSIEESQWQSFINELIPRGIAKLFFFDGEKIQSIADEGNEDIQIKSSFDALLGLDLVEQLSTDIKLNTLRNSKGDDKQILEEITLLTKEKEESEEKLQKNYNKKITLEKEITEVQKKISVQEEKVAKIGGGFATKREQLKIEQSELIGKLHIIEQEIRNHCGGLLPLSLIPKQLDEIKNIIKSDQKKIQSSYEKEILKKNYKELLGEINSEKFLSTLDKKTKKEITLQISELLDNKINSVQNTEDTSFNLSGNDMISLIKLIENIDALSEKNLEKLTMQYIQLMDSLEKVRVGLDSAPKDDEIGPIFSKLQEFNRELGAFQSDLKQLEMIESQETSLVRILNSKIRDNITKKHKDKRRNVGLDLGERVQDVLEEYSKTLRSKKLELLEKYIVDGLTMLLHKKNFIEKVSINEETFEVKLFKGNDDEITKNMLSKGELQMYATAVVWGLAKTSGRPLPFMIDTPLARLDDEHRESLVEKFYPFASHQLIMFSTNSEINAEFYPKLEPYIERSFVLQYSSDKGKSIKNENYFFNQKGEKVIEV